MAQLDWSKVSMAQVATQRGCVPIEPIELYREVFRLGQGWIQRRYEPAGAFKANPIIIGSRGGRIRRKILFEDTFETVLERFSAYEWAYMSGCTYFGRHNTAERQSKLFALIFDLDETDSQHLNDFFHAANNGVYPLPTHIAFSGHGVHLYYVFETPLDLYPHIKTQVKELKFALTDLMWNRYTSKNPTPQHQGINQGFRIPGSPTKPGAPIPVCQAWRCGGGRPVTIDYLNSFVRDESKRVDLSRPFPQARYSLAEAKKKFPDWYARVVEGRQAPRRYQWVCSEALYRWWLRRIRYEATLGHRYFCIMALAIFAAKCGIYDRQRVKRDAMELLGPFNMVAAAPFTEADIDSALECLDARYVTFPRATIEKITAIRIDPTRRNHRTRKDHLQIARAIRDVKQTNLGRVWTDGNSRRGCPNKSHPKQRVVRAWREANPTGRKIECHRETGLSRVTIDKWWDVEYTPPAAKASEAPVNILDMPRTMVKEYKPPRGF